MVHMIVGYDHIQVLIGLDELGYRRLN